MKEQTTCVVIADGTRAKFLTKSNRNLTPILATRHSINDIVIHKNRSASIPGSVSKGIADKGTHSYTTHSYWHHFKKEVFAVEIATILDNIVKNYDKLILIAAPEVLGCLRQHLSPNVASKVVNEIDKDLTKIPLKKVINYVQIPFH